MQSFPYTEQELIAFIITKTMPFLRQFHFFCLPYFVPPAFDFSADCLSYLLVGHIWSFSDLPHNRSFLPPRYLHRNWYKSRIAPSLTKKQQISLFQEVRCFFCLPVPPFLHFLLLPALPCLKTPRARTPCFFLFPSTSRLVFAFLHTFLTLPQAAMKAVPQGSKNSVDSRDNVMEKKLGVPPLFPHYRRHRRER